MANNTGTSEALDVTATQERRLAASESQRCDELLQRNGELMRVIEGLRTENVALHVRLTSMLDARGLETPQATDQTAREFFGLVAVWKAMTIHVSDVSEKCSHPAYMQIIAMGPRALPFIFDELEREPDNWFAALRALTGTNPVPVNSRYNFKETVNAWLEWADQNGYYRGPAVEK